MSLDFDESEFQQEEPTDPDQDVKVDAAEEDAMAKQLDLAHLRDLLSLLREMDVQAFQVPGMSVGFQERSDEERALSRLTPEQREDAERGTSAKPVAGFNPGDTAGFKNPKLWAATNGKRLKLDGSYE